MITLKDYTQINIINKTSVSLTKEFFIKGNPK